MISDSDRSPLLHVVRHGQTSWSRAGRHTGLSDLPLTDTGLGQAERLAPYFCAHRQSLVLTSPLRRAHQTCDAAGLGVDAIVDGDLVEWDYGDYEGRTGDAIRDDRPDWDVFLDGCPGGESPADVALRVDRVIARVRGHRGHTAVFAHGHFISALAARWIGLPMAAGRHFSVDPAAIGVLGDRSGRRGVSVIQQWNLLPGS